MIKHYLSLVFTICVVLSFSLVGAYAAEEGFSSSEKMGDTSGSWSFGRVKDEPLASEDEQSLKEDADGLEAAEDLDKAIGESDKNRIEAEIQLDSTTIRTPHNLSEYLEEIKKELPKGTNSPAMSAAAAQAYNDYKKDKARQEELNRSQVEITQDILDKAFNQGASADSIKQFVDLNQEKGEYAGKHLLVFISSSMPESSIKNMLALLGNNPNVAFVLRGVIGNDVSKMMPTQQWVKALICPGADGEENCYKSPVDINPVLFERLKITEVPAIAYVPNPDNVLPSCDGEATDEDYLVYYGDFSPLYALEKFIERRPQDVRLRGIYEDTSKQGFYQVKPGDSAKAGKTK